MASSNEIPNLKTLLGNRRGGSALRGRGRGRGGTGGTGEENEQARDNAVKGTDQDAAGSRVSCVELGYLHDPYARLFATQPATRRLPLLNRGAHAARLCHGASGSIPQLITCRYICPHLSHRPARNQVPPRLSLLSKADCVSRCWHRHALLPPHGPVSRQPSSLSRNRLPHQHHRKDRKHTEATASIPKTAAHAFSLHFLPLRHV
jgi:hypothetical protein